MIRWGVGTFDSFVVEGIDECRAELVISNRLFIEQVENIAALLGGIWGGIWGWCVRRWRILFGSGSGVAGCDSAVEVLFELGDDFVPPSQPIELIFHELVLLIRVKSVMDGLIGGLGFVAGDLWEEKTDWIIDHHGLVVAGGGFEEMGIDFVALIGGEVELLGHLVELDEGGALDACSALGDFLPLDWGELGGLGSEGEDEVQFFDIGKPLRRGARNLPTSAVGGLVRAGNGGAFRRAGCLEVCRRALGIGDQLLGRSISEGDRERQSGGHQQKGDAEDQVSESHWVWGRSGTGR